jgi:hypothetical protein
MTRKLFPKRCFSPTFGSCESGSKRLFLRVGVRLRPTGEDDLRKIIFSFSMREFSFHRKMFTPRLCDNRQRWSFAAVNERPYVRVRVCQQKHLYTIDAARVKNAFKGELDVRLNRSKL